MKKQFRNVLKEVSREIGAKLWIDPIYGDVGEILFVSGIKTLFRNTSFALNPQSSAELAKDKGYTLMLLARDDLPIVSGETLLRSDYISHPLGWSREEQVDSCIQRWGYPLVLKPNTYSLGNGVYKIWSMDVLKRKIDELFGVTPMLRLERWHMGRDYRIVILDGRVRVAYERIPLTVVGDGVLTIKELFDQKKCQFCFEGRDIALDLSDDRIAHKLYNLGYTGGTIPKNDEAVILLDNANLSTGGESFDITEEIHPDFVDLARKATQTLGLRLAGVDILADDLTLPLNQNKHVAIIELNGAPGLDNYMSSGESQRERVKDLYRDILRALEHC